MDKIVRVSWRDIDGSWQSENAYIPGLPEETPLRPRYARMIARQVAGCDNGIWVIGNDGYGYALYPKTERKLFPGLDY